MSEPGFTVVPTNIPQEVESTPIVEEVIETPKVPKHQLTNRERLIESLEDDRKRMFTPTRREDLLFMLDNKCRCVIYNEIEQFKTLDELLEPYGCVIILYPNYPDSNMGHWCCLFTNNSGTYLEFFDSYGAYIDDKIAEYDELQENDTRMHKPTKIEPTLLKLILESKHKNVHFNDTPYQLDDIDTCTCGLWVVLRLKTKQYNEVAFRKMAFDLPISQGVDPDLMVSELTCHLYPELCVQ